MNDSQHHKFCRRISKYESCSPMLSQKRDTVRRATVTHW